MMHANSIAAHEAIKPRKPSDKARILAQLSYHGMTCSWLERELGMLHQTCSARLAELYQDGKIVEDGIVEGETRWTVAPAGTPPRFQLRCCACGHKL